MIQVLEMTRKHKTEIGYRYRRFQALNDTLELYFHMAENWGWYTVTDLCKCLEYPNTATGRRRVRRMLQALQRVDKMEHKGGKNGQPHFWRTWFRVDWRNK